VTNSLARRLGCLVALALVGCRAPLPCPECGVADDMEEPVFDLPCGGADLESDVLNCGSCGNVCNVLHPDTQYAVGQCNAGECGGPFWYEELYDVLELPAVSCDDLCQAHSSTCHERGCSGKTGFMCGYIWGQGCLNPGGPTGTDFPGITDWTGACAEPVAWPEMDLDVTPALHCCCE
jgi:hypothetical protein